MDNLQIQVDGHIKMATGELYEALKSGDNKKILAPIFKVNKAITPNTYFVSNLVTLADLIFYAYLHKTIVRLKSCCAAPKTLTNLHYPYAVIMGRKAAINSCLHLPLVRSLTT